MKKTTRKRTLGSPFQIGTLSSLIFSAIVTAVMIFYYFTVEDPKPIHLGMVAVGVGSTIRVYFRYIKFWNQGERRLIGDPE